MKPSLSFPALLTCGLLAACAQSTDVEPAAQSGSELTSAPIDLPAATSPYQVTCRSNDPRSDVRVYVTQTNVDRFRGLIRMTKPATNARVYDVVPSWSGSGWNFNVPGQQGESLAPFHMLAFPGGSGNIQVFDGGRPIADVDDVTCQIDM
jgi:hypothetical protein